MLSYNTPQPCRELRVLNSRHQYSYMCKQALPYHHHTWLLRFFLNTPTSIMTISVTDDFYITKPDWIQSVLKMDVTYCAQRTQVVSRTHMSIFSQLNQQFPLASKSCQLISVLKIDIGSLTFWDHHRDTFKQWLSIWRRVLMLPGPYSLIYSLMLLTIHT